MPHEVCGTVVQDDRRTLNHVAGLLAQCIITTVVQWKASRRGGERIDTTPISYGTVAATTVTPCCWTACTACKCVEPLSLLSLPTANVTPLSSPIHRHRAPARCRLCRRSQEWAPVFAPVAPNLVRLLRNLMSLGHAPEYDVAGVADPFLQVMPRAMILSFCLCCGS